MDHLNFVSALLIGMLGSGHCVAMCGGIVGSLSMQIKGDKSGWVILAFQSGRTLSYTLIGAIGGLLGWQANQMLAIPVLKIISGLLLILMALYISQIWNGLAGIERLGKYLWKIVAPIGNRFLPVTNIYSAIGLGAVWGWLPCGLVYTSLGYALSLGSITDAALFMAGFGLGTLPAMFAAGSAGHLIKQQMNSRPIRLFSALLLFLFGVWTLASLFISGGGHHHMHH